MNQTDMIERITEAARTIPPQVLAKVATLPTRERGNRIAENTSGAATHLYGRPASRLVFGLGMVFRTAENRIYGALD